MASNALAATNFPTGLPAIVSMTIDPQRLTFTIVFNEATTIDYPEYIYVSDDVGNAYTGGSSHTDDSITHVIDLIYLTDGYAPNIMNASALAFARDGGARTSLELRAIPIAQVTSAEQGTRDLICVCFMALFM